jgi:2-polyprenyl-6-methoxyphenol hydroxylase-like FAD-dependent oxidoreductase
LRRVGVAVDVAEIRHDVAEQAGVGLSMQGNSMAALGRLGLASACLKAGIPGNYLNIRRPDGTVVARQPLLPMGGPAYPATTGITRKALHRILLSGAMGAGAVLQEGCTVRQFAQDGDGVDVEFNTGRSARYDIMVGADGLYSKTRGALFPECAPVFDGQAVWRAGIPRPRGNFATELHFGGPLGLVGLCPVSADSAYVYIVESVAQGTRHEGDAATATMLEKLAGYSSPLIRAAAQHLPESKSVTFRALESILVAAPWYQGRVVLMGDAAHAGPPVLAQGAAMGIEDAVAFGELAAGDLAIDVLMARFMTRRFPRAALVVRNSRQLCEWEVTHQATPELVGKIMYESQLALAQPF